MSESELLESIVNRVTARVGNVQWIRPVVEIAFYEGMKFGAQSLAQAVGGQMVTDDARKEERP